MSAKIKVLIFFIILYIFAGCSNIPRPYDTFITEDDNARRPIKTYTINEEREAGLNEEMVRKGTVLLKNRRHLVYISNISRTKNGIVLEKGDDLEVKFSQEKNGMTLFWIKGEWEDINKNKKNTSPYFVIYDGGVIAEDKAETLDDGEIYKKYGAIDFFNGQDLNRELFESNEEMEDVTDRESFEFALSYKGMADNKIKFLYKEYYNGTEKTSATKNIVLKISENKRVAYRDLELEIIKAEPEKLRFKVVKD